MHQPVPALHGFATPHATIDGETYSEAGFRWVETPAHVVPGQWVPNKHIRQHKNRIYDASGQWLWKPEVHVAASGKWDALEGSAKKGLPAVGVYNYVTHPSFRLLSLSYNLLDGKGTRLWREGDPDPQDLLEYVRTGGIVSAWNEGFEHWFWNLFCVPRLGWPPLLPDQVRCDMAKAAQCGYPRALDNAGAVLRLTHQKSPEGKGLIRKLTVPKNPTKADPGLRWTRETAPEDFAKFDAYNIRDVDAELEASLRIPDLSPRELEIWRTDQAINRRGMYIDMKAVNDCLVIVGQAYEKYHSELRAITNGAVQKSTEVQPTLKWLETQGVYLHNLDEETVEGALKVHTGAAHRVLKIRQQLAFGSVRKLYAIRTQVCADGRLRDQYAYSAALTHLWNGQGVQVANLYKGKLNDPESIEKAFTAIASHALEYVEYQYGDALECVADCLRSVIVAAPGHRLISSDYTAIQAVVTAAIAGEEWVLDVFRTHGKIYEATASVITGTPLQTYLDYRKREGKHHADRQPYGKIAFLSSGFGGWIGAWKKFGADEYMDDQEIKRAILKWREKSPMIVELWGGQTRDRFTQGVRPRQELYGLEGAAIAAVQNPGKCFAYRGVRYQTHGDVLYCQPPTDCSPLVYHSPRLSPSTKDWAMPWELDLSYEAWDNMGGWCRNPLYGGILTQNVVAKMSREYQCDTLVNLERSRVYLPVMHTHDEAVAEVRIGEGSVEGYLSHVQVTRPGCYDDKGRPWPIKVPGAEETFRYGKYE